MKNILIILVICLMCGICLADDPNAVDPNAVKPTDPNAVVDPNSPQLDPVEVEKEIQELVKKRQDLEQKWYLGTISEVIDQRVADVNDLYGQAKEVSIKAQKVLDSNATLSTAVKTKVLALVKKETGEETSPEIIVHNMILKAVFEMVTDVNSLPDRSDPNYVSEIDRRRDFALTILEICRPI